MLTEKDYCDYDTSITLGELGFPLKRMKVKNFIDGQFSDSIVTVLLYEAQKWLREEKGIIVEVFVDDDSDTPITYNIHKDGECVCHHHGKYWSVKEWNVALSEGIKEAVKILKGEITGKRVNSTNLQTSNLALRCNTQHGK